MHYDSQNIVVTSIDIQLILVHCEGYDERRGLSEGEFAVNTFTLNQERCLDVRKIKGKVGSLSLSRLCLHPPSFWPCDKCSKLLLIMRVTEEEMEARVDRQDEWSIYYGWLQ